MTKTAEKPYPLIWGRTYLYSPYKGVPFPPPPPPVSCESIHLPHVITELKIHHLYSLITAHDDFDNADPSSMQDACHILPQLNDIALQGFS